MERDIRASRVRHLVLALVLATTVALVIHLVLRRTLSLPLAEVIRGVRALQEAGPPTTIHVPGSAGELADLARAFNAMAGQLEAKRQALLRESDERLALERHLKEAEKFAMLGRLSGGLAHELGSPLGVIEMRAERILAERASSPATRRQAEEIISEVNRIARLVHALLHAGRQHGVEHRPVDLGEVIRTVADEIVPSASAAGVRLEVRGPATPLLVGGDATLLRHALFNLAVNAVQALSSYPGERSIGIQLRQEGRWAWVVVEDTGPGIAREHLDHLFEPFYSTKPLGEGTGLGLAISRGIVEEHGGELRIELPEEGGVRAVVVLPTMKTSEKTPKAA
ncbi:MAG: HAMP domain-containing histidine kinase [Gemmatimonadota bacterium]|nr:HAMP domain-containing histidine kinase [Gemmatimonadota bacterium]